jgi:hypothetical protein
MPAQQVRQCGFSRPDISLNGDEMIWHHTSVQT